MGRSGTGLGMAVVWGTVKDHKGYIDIESVEGRGTSFILYFPVSRSAVKPEDRKIPIEDYLAKGETILVVDDVAEQRELASDMLRKLGYATETLASGEEAVEYLKRKPASLVILDMIMDPGIDGLETYRKIREHRPGQKAIIVSGFAETDRVKEAQKLGAGQYLKKPYTLEKIAMAVRRELDKAAYRRKINLSRERDLGNEEQDDREEIHDFGVQVVYEEMMKAGYESSAPIRRRP